MNDEVGGFMFVVFIVALLISALVLQLSTGVAALVAVGAAAVAGFWMFSEQQNQLDQEQRAAAAGAGIREREEKLEAEKQAALKRFHDRIELQSAQMKRDLEGARKR